MWVYPGRHPGVTANTAVRLDEETLAAGLLLDTFPGSTSLMDLAALSVHEAFHVYQGHTPSPAWNADEFDVFTYPLTDPELLAARAMETRALGRALATESGWEREAAAALAWRDARFARLGPEHVRYEQAMERLEGLAHYVELRFKRASPAFPPTDFAAEQVRQRAYATGAAYAFLLDRLESDWKARVIHEGAALDGLLREAVTTHPTELAASGHVLEWARGESARLLTLRRQSLHDFERQVGERLILRSGLPLLPQGFDPLNMLFLGDGAVLHRRFLRFGSAAVRGEVLGRACLTFSSGEHPLTSGFREVQLVGVSDVRVTAEGLTAVGDGLSLQVQGGQVHRLEDGWLCEV